MTRLHSTLHVFSKIILVTPLWPLVLVRRAFFKFALFFHYLYYAGARACIGRKYVDFTPFQSEHFLSFSFLFFFFFQVRRN